METEYCIRQQADVSQINRCIERIEALNESFDDVATVLALVGNSVRLKILLMLHEETRLCVCDLSDILGISLSAVSQHLKRLKDRNLVQREKEAQTVYYSLTEKHDQVIRPMFKTLLSTIGVTA
jgi:DNA-binding transcriptional ArsR family regulator